MTPLPSQKQHNTNALVVGNTKQLKRKLSAKDVVRLSVPNFSEPVSISFIGATVALIFVVIAIGIFFVKKYK